MQKPKKDTNRIAKVNSKIQKDLGEILRDFLADEKGMVTISHVETSQDMKWAKIWISILGGNDEKTFNRLNSHLYELQGALNSQFQTKIIPKISFHLDTNPRYVERIEEVIKKIHSE